MLHKCACCGAHYESSNSKGMNFLPRVCSGECFKIMLHQYYPRSRDRFIREFMLPHNNDGQSRLFSEHSIHWLTKPMALVIPGHMYTIKFEKIDQPSFRSEYEVRFAQWATSCGFIWVYEPFLFQNYIPDFLLMSPYSMAVIEVKGLWEAGAYPKIKRFKKFLDKYEVPFYVVNLETLNRLNRLRGNNAAR